MVIECKTWHGTVENTFRPYEISTPSRYPVTGSNTSPMTSFILVSQRSAEPSRLGLKGFTTSLSAFATLIGYFPNITTLELDSFNLEPDNELVLSLSRPLRGKLRVRDGHGDCLKFFNRFAKLDLEYEELVISSGSSMFVEMAFLNSALKLSANTIKFLRVTTEPEGEQPLPALPIKTTPLPNPLTFKSRVHFRSRTSDNSKSWNWWWLGESPFVKSSSLQSPPQK